MRVRTWEYFEESGTKRNDSGWESEGASSIPVKGGSICVCMLSVCLSVESMLVPRREARSLRR